MKIIYRDKTRKKKIIIIWWIPTYEYYDGIEYMNIIIIIIAPGNYFKQYERSSLWFWKTPWGCI